MVEDFTDVSRSKALQIYTVVVESVESLHSFFRKPRQTSNKLSTPVRIVVSYRDKPVPYCDRRTIRQSRKHFARKADFALVTDKRLAVQYSTVQYSTVQYSTVQYSTVQYSTVQYRLEGGRGPYTFIL